MKDTHSISPETVEVDRERVGQIIQGLQRGDRDMREYWMRELLAAGRDAIPYLQSELNKEHKRRNASVHFAQLSVVIFLLACVSTILPSSLRGSCLVLCLALFAYNLRYIDASLILSPRPKLAESLVVVAPKANDRDTTLFLLELGHYTTANPLTQLLADLLPKLKASDSDLLKPLHRETLNRILDFSTDNRLKLAVLKALEQVGDKTAASFVRALSKRNAGTASDVKVIYAARETLPLLMMRIDATKTSNNLLRPAEQTNDDTLLRSATPTKSTDETLLQSVNADT